MEILPAYLHQKNIQLNEIEAYKTMLSPLKIADDVSGVLFYSPSGIESYLKKNDTDKVAFCIGESTADIAKKYFKNVQVANSPDVESLLTLVKNHFITS